MILGILRWTGRTGHTGRDGTGQQFCVEFRALSNGTIKTDDFGYKQVWILIWFIELWGDSVVDVATREWKIAP